MNTHDKYELPPLPSPFGIIEAESTDSCFYTEKDLADYAKHYARAAIEADRQRSGEQRIIGEILLDAKQHPFARLRTGYDENGDQWKEGTPIYAAPQPAEPVGWPLVTWWDGALGPAERLVESLEGYAENKPGANRDVWAMKAAAKWIRAVLAAPQPAEPVKMRHETLSEHIARDMREGRFPGKSERKMVPDELVRVPSDESLDNLADEFLWDTRAGRRELIRAALARYGNLSTNQHASAEPVKVPSDAGIAGGGEEVKVGGTD